MKMTSAYANKILKKLNEDKAFWRNKEKEGYLYVAALDEEPVVPDYDYEEVYRTIAEIDEKVIKIKHAINVANTNNRIMVMDKSMTIDEILIKMAQLNTRKQILDIMRKTQPMTRISSGYYSSKKTAPEYQYINYDMFIVNMDYDRIDEEITNMQIALDKYNQTIEFDVDI